MTDFIKPRLRSDPDYNQGHLICQTGGLGVKFKFSGLENGIVKMVEQFGSRLYYGYPHKDIFLFHWYSHKRHQLIQNLNKYNPADSSITQEYANDLGLYLHMARIAQIQQWKYPAFISRLPSGTIYQSTGGTRAFAIGLTKPEPWKHFPILMAERFDNDINQILDNPTYIKDDRQLTELLGGIYDKEIWDPTVSMTVEVHIGTPGTNSLHCLLKHVDDFSYSNDTVYYGQEYLKKFTEWKLKYPNRPKLNIYTNYPECIHDINGVWDWKIAGDTGNFESLMGDKVGWVENKIRNYHNDQRIHQDEHVCWLVKKRSIDIGDLLPWMDCDHTTFITNDYSLGLYKPETNFKTRLIDVSYQT